MPDTVEKIISPPTQADQTLDVRNLLCPLPIIRAGGRAQSMQPGEILAVQATDPGLERDLPAWCGVNGHHYLGCRKAGREIVGYVKI